MYMFCFSYKYVTFSNRNALSAIHIMLYNYNVDFYDILILYIIIIYLLTFSNLGDLLHEQNSVEILSSSIRMWFS